MASHRRARTMTLVLLAALFALGLPAVPSSAQTTTSAVALGPVPRSAQLADDLATLPSAAPYGAFVHFAAGDDVDRDALLADHGLVVTGRFDTVDVVYVAGTVGDVRGLTYESAVRYLEADRRLHYFGDTAAWATRARVAHTAASSGPYVDAAGRPLDGTGVGVAVIDTGVDGTHPDLAARMGRNFKVVCSAGPFINTTTGQCAGPIVMEEAVTSDTTGGHGTHVAGIVAGDGTASAGTYRGVAPGATVHGFGTGELTLMFTMATSFDYILQHETEFTPRIRVINNSWGDTAGTPHDPNSVLSKLVRAATGKGITVVFAAGNSGGDGTGDRTSSYSKDPTPGVISAANYDDANTGARDHEVNAGSSRGWSANPRTYPDLSAPGTTITAACTQALTTCARGASAAWAPHYSALTGTSMAAPHIAGAAALLYQARADLTPADVEDLLQDTARKLTSGAAYVADPQNSGAVTSFDKGAGLLDVQAALAALGVAHEGPQFSPSAATIAVTSPSADDTFDGNGPIPVAGTAHDGRPPAVLPGEQLVTEDDARDVEAPGAADLVSLRVMEEGEALRYTLGVRNVTDVGATDTVKLRVTQNVAGRRYYTDVNLTAQGVVADTASSASFARAQAPTRDVVANTVSFTLPFSLLGNPPSGSVVHNVFASSFIGAILDVAPGGLGTDTVARPRHGTAFTIVRPGATAPPVATVTVAVDDGTPMSGRVEGAGPAYTWDAAIDATALADGEHALTARLFLNGLLASTTTTTFRVQRPAYAHAIAITAPADDSDVPRAGVTVTGTATSEAPLTQPRLVTVQLTGGSVDSGEAIATGTDAWQTQFDFSVLTAGAYTLTARLYVGDVEVASDVITVHVAPVEALQVACAPEALSFWRQQFAGTKSAFTAAERAALSEHAAFLSGGYFTEPAALVDALLAGGRLSAEQQAARQWAALLLNLAAGDRSATMSKAVGLAGWERLSAKHYDIARLGTTVDAANAWVAAQFPSGDLGAANEVATALNKGFGLEC